MLTKLKAALTYPKFEKDLANDALARNGEPLLEALLQDKVKWCGGTSSCRSLGGNFVVENDMYFYFRVRGKSITNLVDNLTATRIECLAVNNARIGNAVSDETLLKETKTT